jgi:hypothetical protein
MGYDLHNQQYPFPLNYLESAGGAADDAFVEGNLGNTLVGDNWYVLCLTGQQMIDLQSIIAIGAPIIFPDTYMDTVQRYAQLAEFPNEIPEANCMDLCQLILDCINDTPALQQAIAQYSLVSPIPQTAPEVQANLDAELVNDPVGCDNDIIFGMTTGYTDLMNTISEDILAMFVAGTSPAGRIGDIIEAVPVIGEAPIDDLYQFVESFINDLADAYDGAYTSQVRDDIRCDLYCLAVPQCSLTMEMARDYFYDKLGESISIDAWDGFLDDIIAISYSGEPAIWALHLLITQTMIFGGDLIGFDTSRLIATVQSLFNDPDSDWDTVCTDCPFNTYAWDFTVHSGSFTAFAGRANWVDGSGYEADGVNYLIQLDTVAFDLTGIKWVELEISTLLGADPAMFQFRGAEYGGGGGNFDKPNVGSTIMRSTLDVDCDALGLGIDNNSVAYTGFITRCTIRLQPGETIPSQWSGGTPSTT